MPKVFIGSIKKSTHPSSLTKQLLSLPIIKKVKVLYPKKGTIKKGFSIVEIDLIKISLKEFLTSKIPFEGKDLHLTEYLEGNKIEKRNKELAKKKVYVCNVPLDLDNQTLHKLFSHFGDIETAYVSKANACKAFMYAFVTFMDDEAAIRCVEQKKVAFGDRFLRVKPFTPKTVNGATSDSSKKSQRKVKVTKKLEKLCGGKKQKKQKDVLSKKEISSSKNEEENRYIKKKTPAAGSTQKDMNANNRRDPERKRVRQRPKETLPLEEELSAIKLVTSELGRLCHTEENLRLNYNKKTALKMTFSKESHIPLITQNQAQGPQCHSFPHSGHYQDHFSSRCSSIGGNLLQNHQRSTLNRHQPMFRNFLQGQFSQGRPSTLSNQAHPYAFSMNTLKGF